jgi:hypothetical protein
MGCAGDSRPAVQREGRSRAGADGRRHVGWGCHGSNGHVLLLGAGVVHGQVCEQRRRGQ